MLAELAFSLRDDLRPHMPELLPRLVALFVDAERTGNYEMVKPGLEALEVNFCIMKTFLVAFRYKNCVGAAHV
jgi:hypothetical protein